MTMDDDGAASDGSAMAAAQATADDIASRAGEAVYTVARDSAKGVVDFGPLTELPVVSDIAAEAENVGGWFKRRATSAAARGLRRLARSVDVELTGAAAGDLASKAVNEAAQKAKENAEDRLGEALGTLVVRAVTSPRRAAEEAAAMGDATLEHWEQLVDRHDGFVRPVGWVSKGIPFLHPINVMGVPLSVVVAMAALGWTVVVTGDVLDSKHYPDFISGMKGPSPDYADDND